MTAQRLKRRSFIAAASSIAGVVVLAPWLEGCVAEVGDGLAEPGDGAPAANPAWEQEAEAIEGAKVYDANTLWKDNTAKAGTHVPQPSLAGRALSINVPHPMTPEHWIRLVYLRDQDNIIVAFQEIPTPAAGTDQVGVTATLNVPAGVTSVTAYAHCNLHDVWRSAPVSVA